VPDEAAPVGVLVLVLDEVVASATADAPSASAPSAAMPVTAFFTGLNTPYVLSAVRDWPGLSPQVAGSM
jgi:hypothetical protein